MKAREIEKAYEITDAKISFVSLVNKAANKRTFLLKKAEDGSAKFTTYGRIVKADGESHAVTGIVYEPMAEDTDGNYMTEAEITKAAHWFAKNGGKVDLQHSFSPMDGAAVVESYVAKCDMEIGGEKIRKGTWLMTMEIEDGAVWDAIEKGEITGFSMGGVGTYSEEDTPIAKDDEKRGLLRKMADMLGVKKGKVADRFEMNSTDRQLGAAIDAFRDALSHYDGFEGRPAYETDPAKVQEALDDLGAIVLKVLTGAEPVEKQGKTLSSKNYGTLKGIHEQLGEFLADFDEEGAAAEKKGDEPDGEEEVDMSKEEVEKMLDEKIQKALAKAEEPETPADVAAEGEAPAAETEAANAEPVTADAVEKMVNDAVAAQAEKLGEMVEKAVEKNIQPFLASRGLPSNMNDTVEKSAKEDECFLHGLL